MRADKEYTTVKNLFDLSGKVAIVNGGTSGIGFASARRFAEAGAAVIITGRQLEKGEAKAEQLIDAGYTASFVKCDVSQETDVDKLIESAVAKYGRLDIMMNNVGIFPGKPLVEMDTKIMDDVFAANVRGTFFGITKASRQMIKQGSGGTIINMASVAAHTPHLGCVAYDSSKAAVWMMTKTSALELAPYGIRVNSISPGMISTEGVTFPEAEEVTRRRLPGCPWGRVGDADEVATVALFLSSPAASYLTGSDIIVDGGWTLYEHQEKENH